MLNAVRRGRIYGFLVFAVSVTVVFIALTWVLQPSPVLVPDSTLPTSNWQGDALLPLMSVGVFSVDQNKARIGERLFFDPRLSANNQISCASCHHLRQGGADKTAFSTGIHGQRGTSNTPTVFNAALHFFQFWDGRARTLEQQAAGPLHDPLEMGSNWSQIIRKLRQDKTYREAFAKSYPEGVTPATVLDALASFERTLLTPNSRVDQFLAGNRQALTPIEQRGYQRFMDFGCASCHQGIAFGGNLFQKVGVMRDYFQGRQINRADLGRFNVTGKASDRHVFKVPSLRNVALTAPYFHDGSVKTLDEAIVLMGNYQLGRTLSQEDVLSIHAFLHAMTGEWQGESLQ